MTLTAVLQALPWTARLNQNQQIMIRNQQRSIKCAYGESNPQHNKIGEQYSLDESLCSISDDESPTGDNLAPLSDLSPNALRTLTANLLKQKNINKDSDEDSLDLAILKAKRQLILCKAEVTIK